MATPSLIGLVYSSSQYMSHEEKRLVFVSRNERALESLKNRLSKFCINDECFSLERLGFPVLKDGYYVFISESYSDYDYCMHVDTFDIDLIKQLKDDQFFNKKKVISNPSISEINQFCRFTWGFNDFQKRIGLINRIERAKKTGDYWQNPLPYKQLENLL